MGKYIEFNYGQGKVEWGDEIANAIWHEFDDPKTVALATQKEVHLLAVAKKIGDVKGIILNVARRSAGGG